MEPELIKAIGVTFELSGSPLTKEAKSFAIRVLEDYPEDSVRKALEKCVTQVHGKMSLAKIIEQIDDGRPGPDEAWARLPKTEAESAMMTAEMGAAYDTIRGLMTSGPECSVGGDGRTYQKIDMIAARKAFLEAYKRLTSDARQAGDKVKWIFSGGHDASRHEGVLRDAMRKGLIDPEQAQYHCPDLIGEMKEVPQLSGEVVPPEELHALIQRCKEKVGWTNE